jgi:tetratricopeptide (TPR) repeat protein
MADRYAYVSFIGLFIVVCWGIPDLYAKVVKSDGQAPDLHRAGAEPLRIERAPAAIFAGSLVVLALLAMTSYRQIGYWKNSLTLWSHAVQVDKTNEVAQDKLGSLLVVSGHENEAMAHFRAAIETNPSDPQLNFHMGFSEQRQGNLTAAVDYYKKVLSLTQDDILLYAGLRNDALTNMSVAYKNLGDYTKAAECFDEAARLRQQYQK